MHLGFIISVFFPFCLGNSEDHLVPMLVSGLRGYHVIDVACGSGDAHSLAVADDGKNLYTLVSSPFYSKYIVVIDIENSLKFQIISFCKILMKVKYKLCRSIVMFIQKFG